MKDTQQVLVALGIILSQEKVRCALGSRGWLPPGWQHCSRTELCVSALTSKVPQASAVVCCWKLNTGLCEGATFTSA